MMLITAIFFINSQWYCTWQIKIQSPVPFMAPSGFLIKVCLVRVRGALLSSGEALLSKTSKSRLIDLL